MTAGGYPGGRRFAFTIMDDTDVATVANVGPVYRLLAELGLRTTKTVWPVGAPEGSANFASSETLEDPAYLAFVQGLQRQGFEIAFHGATMETSERGRVEAALARFEACFGAPPRVHANHAYNRDNLYWGPERLDDPLVRAFYRLSARVPDGLCQGHVAGSPWGWGDLCHAKLHYVRNLTFAEVNLLRVNPSMPYHDARRGLVRWWFSASDAEDRIEFNRLLRSENQARLEAEGGVCIVATHLGKGFARDGEVHPETRRLLAELAARPGWFVPVGELLDWLLERRGADQALPAREWRRMQWRWAWEMLQRRVRRPGPIG